MNEDLVRIGTLALALCNASDDEEVETLGAKFDAEVGRLNRMDPGGILLVLLAEKLLGGRPYLINTDKPDTVARVRSLAAYLGATVTEQDSQLAELVAVRYSLRVDPAPRERAQ